MKRFFLLILFLGVSTGTSKAQTFQVDTIRYNGNPAKYINLVFLGDGYTASEMATFVANITSFTNGLFTFSPFSEYSNYFNVFAIWVPSQQSGTDHPMTASDCWSSDYTSSDSRNTYFNTTFDLNGVHRAIAPATMSAVNTVLFNNFPQYDQTVLMVHTSYYGGTGGPIATSTEHSQAVKIVTHEMGHSFGSLADEYYAGDPYASERPNMTMENNPSLVRWAHWVGTNGISVYQHCCSGNSSIWNKPSTTCLMESLVNNNFCEVCRETIIEKVHLLFGTPILSRSPIPDQVYYCTEPTVFSLDLETPTPNTLRVQWLINGQPYGGNSSSISVPASYWSSIVNIVQAKVMDTTSMVRTTNHPQYHEYISTWTTTIGLDTSVTSIGGILSALYPSATYQWVTCPDYQPVPGATSQTFIPSATGNYAVIIQQGSCRDTSSCYFVVSSGTEDLAGTGSFTVYPNPAGNEFYVRGGVSQGTIFELMNLSGQVLSKGILDENAVVPAAGYSPGLYLLKLRSAEGNWFKKIVIR